MRFAAGPTSWPKGNFPNQVFTWEQWERIKAAKDEKEANAQMDAAKKAGKVIIKDAIADITLQQVLTRPDEFDVVATMNLNGDYLSDALAAQVGGIGIAPGGNINYMTGHAVFEATHGTAPKYADLDKVNPGSVILSGEMMFSYMGWLEAADAIISAMDKSIAQKTVTYDFARLMPGATEVKCSEFGDILIRNLIMRLARSQPRGSERRARRRLSGAVRLRALLQDIECRNPIRFGHGREIEDLFDEEIGGGAGGDGRLPQMNEFGRALAQHLDAQDPRAAALA